MHKDLEKLKAAIEEIVPDHPERLGGSTIDRAILGTLLAILEQLEVANAKRDKDNPS